MSHIPGVLPSELSNFHTWKSISSLKFTMLLDTTYAEVGMHWRHNCIFSPFGKAKINFVSELSRLYLAYESSLNAWSHTCSLESCHCTPILLLQNPLLQEQSGHQVHHVCAPFHFQIDSGIQVVSPLPPFIAFLGWYELFLLYPTNCCLTSYCTSLDLSKAFLGVGIIIVHFQSLTAPPPFHTSVMVWKSLSCNSTHPPV